MNMSKLRILVACFLISVCASVANANAIKILVHADKDRYLSGFDENDRPLLYASARITVATIYALPGEPVDISYNLGAVYDSYLNPSFTVNYSSHAYFHEACSDMQAQGWAAGNGATHAEASVYNDLVFVFPWYFWPSTSGMYVAYRTTSFVSGTINMPY
jgi:hypothetical protein